MSHQPNNIFAGTQVVALLSEAFEAQLEGNFTDLAGALKWLDSRSCEEARHRTFVG